MIEITTSYHEKGKEEGIKIGEERGRLEGKVEVAKKLLAKNIM